MKRSCGPHRYVLVEAMTLGLGVAPLSDSWGGARVEVNVLVSPEMVESPIDAEGVDVMVVSLPEMVVTSVVGASVRVKVLKLAPEVDTKVRVMGAEPLGVMTTTSTVGVPPSVVVKLVAGGVVTLVTGVPSTVVTKVVGGGVSVTTVGVPPTILVVVYETG